MSNTLKTYFLSPTLDIPPPPTGPIALGSIIYDPQRPERSLNPTSRVPIPPAAIHHTHKADWSDSRLQGHEAQGGLWASFLQLIVGIGGDISANSARSTTATYACQRLETQFFLPDDRYLRESLRDPPVRMWMERGRFGRKAVYMVTGLKIARGVTAETKKAREYGVEGNVGVDLTAAGVPVEAGPQAKWAVKKEEGVAFAGSSDCVFAFQVVRIRARKRDGQVEQEDYNRGALYEMVEDVGDGEEEEGDPRDTWEIEEAGGFGDEGADLVVRSTVDEYGDACEAVFGKAV